MPSYVVLPRLKVENANAQPAWWLASAPALTAYAGFVHALGRSFEGNNHGEDAQTPSGFAVIHHDIQFLGDIFYGKFYKFYPQQMRAAMLINEDDHIGKPAVANAKSKQSIQRSELGDQPTIRCHLTVSLVIRFEDSELNSDKIQGFLRRSRLAGGTIVNSQKYQAQENSEKKLVFDSLDEVLKKIPKGFVIQERQDLMVKTHAEEDWLDVLLRVTSQPKETGKGWIMPSTLGYLTISDIKERKYSRNGLPHAYVEPLVGLIQYQSFDRQTLPFWRWTHPNPRCFILSTQLTS